MKDKISSHSLLCTELFTYEQFPFEKLFQDKQYPWEVLLELAYFLKAFDKSEFNPIETKAYPHAHFINPESIYIAKGVTIEPGAFIAGPCAIGVGSSIRHAAYIRENTLIGNNCVVGHCSEVKGSILLNNSKASHFAYVGDSILGEGVNLGAGTKLANLRFDRKEVLIQIGREKLSTGLKKLGALLGDRAQIGCNCVTNPGTVVGKDGVGPPLGNLSGCHFQKIRSTSRI